jgi:hypothetical protein
MRLLSDVGNLQPACDIPKKINSLGGLVVFSGSACNKLQLLPVRILQGLCKIYALKTSPFGLEIEVKFELKRLLRRAECLKETD